MPDARIPLPDNSSLLIDGDNYIIKQVIGYGGSCLAYSAWRTPNEYEQSIGMPPFFTVIKELYPSELARHITRCERGLLVHPTAKESFDFFRKRFERGAVRQASFFHENTNRSFSPARIAAANNTLYTVVDSVQGNTLDHARDGLDMEDVSEIMGSLCHSVKALHDDEKLHLDIKPSNIFLFNKDSGDSYRIALFDFDSIISVSDVASAIIPFSDGWAPHEQVNQIRHKISYATDIYSIGAVLYWLISGEKVSPRLLNDIKRQRFDFFEELPILENKQSPRKELKELLPAMLKRDPNERAQSLDIFDL